MCYDAFKSPVRALWFKVYWSTSSIFQFVLRAFLCVLEGICGSAFV